METAGGRVCQHVGQLGGELRVIHAMFADFPQNVEIGVETARPGRVRVPAGRHVSDGGEQAHGFALQLAAFPFVEAVAGEQVEVAFHVAQGHVDGVPAGEPARQWGEHVQEARVQKQAVVGQAQRFERVGRAFGQSREQRDGRGDRDVWPVQAFGTVGSAEEDVVWFGGEHQMEVDVTVRTGESVRVAAAHPCGEHATVHVGCERLFETVHRSIPNDSR